MGGLLYPQERTEIRMQLPKTRERMRFNAVIDVLVALKRLTDAYDASVVLPRQRN